MLFENLLLERDGPVAVLTINRPKSLNALNRQTLEELGQAFDQLREDAAIHCVIITGAGDRAFIAGADINEVAVITPSNAREQALSGQHLFSVIETLGKPVVAAINGFAFGGGLELALACTFRLASQNAKLGLPEIKLGLIPGYGGTQRLPRLIGEARALDMILLGRTVSASEALSFGLIHRLVDADVLSAAMAFTTEFSSYSRIALNLAREAVTRALDNPVHEGLKIEADLSTLAFGTADAAEGMAAFTDKRQAKFKDE